MNTGSKVSDLRRSAAATGRGFGIDAKFAIVAYDRLMVVFATEAGSVLSIEEHVLEV